MAKSWLDVKVDLEVTRSRAGGEDLVKKIIDLAEGSPGHVTAVMGGGVGRNRPSCREAG